MKEINTYTIEQSLLMYKETVSPKEEYLQAILSQLPEKKIESVSPAIRSPYIWIAVTEVMVLCSLLLVILPTYMSTSNVENTSSFVVTNEDDPFYALDTSIDTFESEMNSGDYENSLIDYTI